MLTNKLLSASAAVVQKDPYYNYVTMLLHADGTNGAGNNSFIDSSINNLNVTASGTPTQGSLNPYGTVWSNYFNGAQYFTVPDNAAFEFGSGDFTVEAWIFLTGYSASYSDFYAACILAKDITTSRGFEFRITGTSNSYTGIQALLHSTNTVFTAPSASVSVSLNAWHHVAFTRESGVAKIFFNGRQLVSVADTTNIQNTTSAVSIGAAEYTGFAQYFPGYISNLRVVKGSAIYTSDFTPPTAPLTAISGTSLLTCQSNRFIDKSSNAFTISLVGAPLVKNFSPFIESTPYTKGSLFFNANASYLRIASNSVLAIGTSNFTWETWFYPNSFGQVADGGDTLLYTGVSSGLLIGRPQTNGGGWGLGSVGFSWRLLTSSLPINGQWNHMAISRSGVGTNQTALWLNGVRVAVGTVSSSFAQGYVDLSSGGTGYDLDGWLADYRLIKGTAIYDPSNATYTVPTQPLTAITNTSLLLSGLNAGIFDSTTKHDLATISNVQISTSIKKFGTGSISFSSTGGRLRIPYDPILDVVTQTFTFEGWIYPTASNTVGTRIFSTGGGSATWNNTNGIHILIQIRGANSNLNLQLSNNTTTQINISTTDSIPINQWTFISVCVIGSTAYLGVNGNVISASVSGRARPSTNPITELGIIPGETFNLLSYIGYMDEIRFTTGVARYTSNFIPPTSAFLDK